MLKGVVEGFYGSFWSFDDRISVIDFMYKNDLNIYIYGPKDDPYHRVRWRESYPDKDMERFKMLIDYAERYNIDFSIALSPGLDINYESDKDLKLLIDKIARFIDLGSDIVSIFLDDIPAEKEDPVKLADKQVRFLNKIFRELSPREMIFCPTHYWGFKREYLEKLRELESKIHVMWTGRAVISPKITREDLEIFKEIVGRKPFIWDNYPVNDFFTVRGVKRLHLDYIKGRDPEIINYIDGYVSNPMNEAELSKISLYSISKLLKGYRTSMKDVIEYVDRYVEDDLFEEIIMFILFNRSSILDPYADIIPSPDDGDKLIKLSEYLEKNIRNKKMFNEIKDVLVFLKELGIKIKSGEKIIKTNVYAAGLYKPFARPERVLELFGREDVYVKPWWYRED
ncbi:MAG: beta-N-acetylglucosaminidase domain-containing protein [Desulfurococcaceae archaeon]|nr:beta-N-acetylglucosaminidase domain-containing protein [Desulfurococcaceae archaeon]